MTAEGDKEALGPIDSRTWPQQLDAHAVSPNILRISTGVRLVVVGPFT